MTRSISDIRDNSRPTQKLMSDKREKNRIRKEWARGEEVSDDL